MTIIDANASCGPWLSRPPGEQALAEVWRELRGHGVQRALMASLESAWCANPHAANARLLTEAAVDEHVLPVPTIDPTVHTWREHLAFVAQSGDVRMVRLLPAYSPYDLDHPELDPLLDELRRMGLATCVQTRIEDPRRHHPRAQVPDVPAADVLRLARRHPSQVIVIGGARFAELRALRDEILEHNLVYADTSQCDGLDAVATLCGAGLTERLLYGSHAPLFGVASSLRRVIDDLSPADAERVLGGNARRVFGLPARARGSA